MELLKKIPIIQRMLREEGLRAFRLAHKDILDTMQDDLDKQASELAEKMLGELLVGTDLTHILTTQNNQLYIGGERPDPLRVQNLRSEAHFLKESELWKVLYDSPKALAEKAMFVDDGTIENQLIKGRAILYCLSTQKKIVETLASVTLST